MTSNAPPLRPVDPRTDAFGYRRDPALVAAPSRGVAVVYDTEFTAWEGSLARNWSEPWESREVFQIGAVRLSMDEDWSELGSFEVLIRPARNPELSDYVVALTGVTRERLAREGGDAAAGLRRFARFCEGADLVVSNGWDGVVLRETLALAGVNESDGPILPEDRMADARGLISGSLGLTVGQAVSSDLWRHIGAEGPAGREHDALADARAVAAALRWIARWGSARDADCGGEHKVV